MNGIQVVGEIISYVLVLAFSCLIAIAIHALPAMWIFEILRFNAFKCLNSFYYLGFISEKSYYKSVLITVLKLVAGFFVYVCTTIIIVCDFDIYGSFKDNLLLCVYFICSVSCVLFPYFEHRFHKKLTANRICDFVNTFDNNYNQKTPRENTKDETVLNAIKGSSSSWRLEQEETVTKE